MLSAIAIGELALEALVAVGAEKAADAAIEQGKKLWERIKSRFQGKSAVEPILAEVETQQSEAAMAKVVRLLDAEMLLDEAFAQELDGLGQQILQLKQENNTSEKSTINAQSYGQSKQVNIIQSEGGTFTL